MRAAGKKGVFTLKTHQMFSVYMLHYTVEILKTSTLKRKVPGFQIHLVKIMVEKLRFRDRLVWTVGLTVKKSCVFKTR